MLKRTQKVFLETEVGEFSLFEKLHRQLTQRVDREEGYILIGQTTNLMKIEESQGVIGTQNKQCLE